MAVEKIFVTDQGGIETDYDIGANSKNVRYAPDETPAPAGSVEEKITNSITHANTNIGVGTGGAHGLRASNTQVINNSQKKLQIYEDGEQKNIGGGSSGSGDMKKEDYTTNDGVLDIIKPEKGGTGNGNGYIQIGQNVSNNIGDYATAEGLLNNAEGTYSHAEGNGNQATLDCAHAEGYSTRASRYAHAENMGTYAYGDGSHAEGMRVTAVGQSSHAEGESTNAISNPASLDVSNYIDNYGFTYGTSSHSEGKNCQAVGNFSHAEGNGSQAKGNSAHAEGSSKASGDYSHAEGTGVATGDRSHAEGGGTQAIGDYSHAEGRETKAIGDYSHAGGRYSVVTGDESAAQGFEVKTTGSGAATLGWYIQGDGDNSLVIGKGKADSQHIPHLDGDCLNRVDNEDGLTVINGYDGKFKTNVPSFMDGDQPIAFSVTTSKKRQAGSNTVDGTYGAFLDISGTEVTNVIVAPCGMYLITASGFYNSSEDTPPNTVHVAGIWFFAAGAKATIPGRIFEISSDQEISKPTIQQDIVDSNTVLKITGIANNNIQMQIIRLA